MALDRLLSSFCFFLFILSFATAYEVPVLDTDYSRQICSGMWGGHSTYINGKKIELSLSIARYSL
jgi:hypothetical protein